jgi:hypothetical protein
MTKEELKQELRRVFRNNPRKRVDIAHFCMARKVSERLVRKSVHDLVREGFLQWARKWDRIEKAKETHQ